VDEIGNPSRKSAAVLGNSIAKTCEHAVFKGRIWLFLSESFFKNFVHGFDFPMSFSACGAIDEVRVKRAAFIL
jgi:hypothetical protein